MPHEIILASNNAGKLSEIRAVMQGYTVLSLKDAGLSVDPDETGATFFQNALIKAKAVYALCRRPVLADDSGLCVTALGGAPGVYSARYSESGTDADNNRALLTALDGVTDRRAAFRCVLVYYDGRIRSSAGETRGEILSAPRGGNGFGYDPLFYSYDLGRSFGEADAGDKNNVSHRARALSALKTLVDKEFKS